MDRRMHPIQPPYEAGQQQQPREHPAGTTVLVLGILSLMCCGLTGPIAWFKGSRAMREIDTNPNAFSNSGTVQAGRVTGIIGTAILVMALIVLAIFTIVVERIEDAEVNTATAICKTDTKTLKSAMVSWNTDFATGTSGLPTPWPRSDSELVFAKLIAEESPLHELTGDGSSPPIITSETNECANEEIVQFN